MVVEKQIAVIHAGSERDEWDDTRKEFIRKNFCGGAPDAMAATFLALCERRRLSPEARHVYLINRAAKDRPANWVIQTGIDGYRLIADRTGRYVGSDDPVFEYNAERTQIIRATVTVRKLVGGVVGAFTASARMDEYAAGGPMWGKMPHTLISKCAEALALRKAFPEELSGLYTDTEMDQAETPAIVAPARPQVVASTGEIIDDGEPMITAMQIKRMHALRSEKGLTNDQLKAMHGKASAKLLTAHEAGLLIGRLVSLPDQGFDEQGDRPNDAQSEQPELLSAPGIDRYTS